MKRQWILAAATALATLALGLALLRWLAPQLVGVPADLQMVRVARELPPFFDGVFRDEDYASGELLLADPYLRRGRPLYPEGEGVGPHDILGFRNRSVPHQAAVVVIGDSQTYGLNVRLEESWPQQLGEILGQEAAPYTMAVGGWGAVDYLEIAPRALLLRPRLLVVAFYTGNDSLESALRAYSRERWAELRPSGMAEVAAPRVEFPPPESEWWPVRFDDGVATVFTPRLRWGANRDHPAVEAGYRIMAEVARRVAGLAREAGAFPVFTVLPTKELVFADRIEAAGMAPPASYRELVAAESARLAELTERLRAIDGALFVDCARALSRAAADAEALYRDDIDGHPQPAAHAAVAQALAAELRRLPRAFW